MDYRGGPQYSPRRPQPEDWEQLPPDYGREPSPPRQQGHAGGGYPSENGGPASDQYYQGNSRYPSYHYRGGSGEFDNPGFSDYAAHNASYTMSEGDLDHHRGPSGYDHRSDGAFNPSYSFDETDYQPNRGVHRRYSPRKKSSRRAARMRSQDDDADSITTMTPEDLQRARDFLATIRIKRRTRRSVKRSQSRRGEDDDEDGPRGDGDSDEVAADYEEVGLPSTRAMEKPKTLTERLQELQGTNAEVAKSLRESYAEFDPSLVASAAWKGWEKRKAQISDFWNQLDIWSSHFKEIEGRFGSATASYFRFTRWLVFLNFYTFLVSFLVIVMPFFASSSPSLFIEGLDKGNPQPIVNESIHVNQAINCSVTYITTIDNYTSTEDWQDEVLDFFVGTGWMERTSMFYGYYHNRTFNTGDSSYNYNMGLAYLLSIGVTFLISFVLILVNSSSSVKSTVVDDQEHTSVHFTNSVMCGWDFCIMDTKTANSKRKILCQEFKADLLEQSKRMARETRTSREKAKLVLVRVAINFVVLCILGGSIYLIYFTTNSLLDLREKTDDQALLLIIQLLPSLTITFLNFIVPEFFNILVSFEDYWPAFQLKITLIRTVFLRLSSLGVLTFSLYYTLLWPRERDTIECVEENKNDTKCCSNFLWQGQKREGNTSDSDNALSTVQCWETYVGQQFYKLAIVDFAALILVTFIVEFPRKLVYNKLGERIALVKKFGQQEFDIPRNVLDIVYSQTLSWLGTFFAPLLPVMTLLKVFFIFYIKKLTLMKNCAPPQNVYRVSRSNSFFNIILLISFVLVAIIIGYMVGNINPSKSCGPYRLYSLDDYVTWVALTDVISSWPNWASKLFFFFGTTAFFVPCFLVLCLMMYYYWAVGQGYKRRDEILQEQLKLEGKDKQFLLARVNDIIKHGNLQGITSGRPQPSQ